MRSRCFGHWCALALSLNMIQAFLWHSCVAEKVVVVVLIWSSMKLTRRKRIVALCVLKSGGRDISTAYHAEEFFIWCACWSCDSCRCFPWRVFLQWLYSYKEARIGGLHPQDSVLEMKGPLGNYFHHELKSHFSVGCVAINGMLKLWKVTCGLVDSPIQVTNTFNMHNTDLGDFSRRGFSCWSKDANLDIKDFFNNITWPATTTALEWLLDMRRRLFPRRAFIAVPRVKRSFRSGAVASFSHCFQIVFGRWIRFVLVSLVVPVSLEMSMLNFGYFVCLICRSSSSEEFWSNVWLVSPKGVLWAEGLLVWLHAFFNGTTSHFLHSVKN